MNIIEYIREQLQHLEQQKTYTDWEEARRQGGISALEDVLEQLGETY
jgi:hypothetical protein